ncbi:MAG: amidohydrolase family protein [Geminicoccaceae bacterium]
MNIHVSEAEAKKRAARVGLAIADADVHPALANPKALHPYLAQRWRDHMDTYGMIPRHQYQAGPAYPKGNPDASRRDAYPPEGGRPGSSLSFMRAQHLDPNNVELGILNPLAPTPGNAQNLELSSALATAMNEWQLAEWMEPEPRLKGSIMPPYEDAAASVTEINRWAGNPHFAQILLLSRTTEPLGQRRYWPIYEAAASHNLPVAIHAFGYGGNPVTSGGWPSFYIEEMCGHAQCCQALLASMVLEGVFEHFPTLKIILVEAGFAWLPALAWRLDTHWHKLKGEIPHLKRPPSEVIREHVWLTTQPMEEPDTRRHLKDTWEWIGADRLIFATDYPHWDYDDPVEALPIRLDDAAHKKFFRDNARTVYGL